MSATGADSRPERTRLHRESRTWRLIRRALPLRRPIGSLFYLISVGLAATWVIAVFFGAGLFFLMPRAAKLESGLGPGSTDLNASSAEPPGLSTQPQIVGDSAQDKGGPVVVPAAQKTGDIDPAPLRTPALPAMAHPTTVVKPEPMLPAQDQFFGPEPPVASQSAHSSPSRKPVKRRRVDKRAAQPRSPVSAIQDVLQKHSGLLK
jgi:hypothetical protein